MARWDPGAEDRLRQAAMDLFLERGFEAVTATDIAVRAGLTRRTFFRYFTDKREVLFAGSEQLVDAVADAAHAVDARRSPIETVLQALSSVGSALAELSARASDRRTVIAASPDLQERERTKMAAVTAALTAALRQRGIDDSTAHMFGQVGVAVFATAFGRWVDSAGRADFAETFQQTVAELRSAMADG
jgi:AcrR family transcriptional regulator